MGITDFISYVYLNNALNVIVFESLCLTLLWKWFTRLRNPLTDYDWYTNVRYDAYIYGLFAACPDVKITALNAFLSKHSG